MITQTDANGHTTTYTYDPLNRRSTMTDALGDYPISIRHRHRLPAASHPCGATPGSSLVTEQIDPDDANPGRVTYFKYDALDRLIIVVRKVGSSTGLDTITPSDAVTTYTYDPVGNRLTVTEPDGNTTTYQYDADNRRTK